MPRAKAEKEPANRIYMGTVLVNITWEDGTKSVVTAWSSKPWKSYRSLSPLKAQKTWAESWYHVGKEMFTGTNGGRKKIAERVVRLEVKYVDLTDWKMHPISSPTITELPI